jgi:hypothetical protein
MSMLDTIRKRATRYVVCPSGLVFRVRRIKSSDTQGRFLSIIGLGSAASAFEKAAMSGDDDGLAYAMAERARQFASEIVHDTSKLDELAGFRDSICCAGIVAVGEVAIPPDDVRVCRSLGEVGPLTQDLAPMRFAVDEDEVDHDAGLMWVADLEDDDRAAVSAAVQALVNPGRSLQLAREAS